jgi:hypothetical protein
MRRKSEEWEEVPLDLVASMRSKNANRGKFVHCVSQRFSVLLHAPILHNAMIM